MGASRKKVVAPLPAMLRPGVVDDRYQRQLAVFGDLAELHEVHATSGPRLSSKGPETPTPS